MIRRIVDAACDATQDKLMMVFLDWAKAFDRIKPDIMLQALTRFGLPLKVVNMIRGIYDSRQLFIADHTGNSCIHAQEAGIAQGCPLSPFLFIIVQTVMFHDIYKTIHLEEEPAFVVTRDLLYADDTALLSGSQTNLQKLLHAVVVEGAKYGLELNWEKTFQMNVNTDESIYRPGGSALQQKDELIYLGGMISSDSCVSRELNRRLGEGRSLFNILKRFWSHANLTMQRKLRVFNACITSKVMYALDSAWFLKVDRTRLDAFQCACLRRILKIPPSYISRITNAEVLRRSSQTKFSCLLESRQKHLYQKIQMMPASALMRKLVCDVEGGPINWNNARKPGRPCQRWGPSVFKLIQACPIDRYWSRPPFLNVGSRIIRCDELQVPFFQPSTETWW